MSTAVRQESNTIMDEVYACINHYLKLYDGLSGVNETLFLDAQYRESWKSAVLNPYKGKDVPAEVTLLLNDVDAGAERVTLLLRAESSANAPVEESDATTESRVGAISLMAGTPFNAKSMDHFLAARAAAVTEMLKSLDRNDPTVLSLPMAGLVVTPVKAHPLTPGFMKQSRFATSDEYANALRLVATAMALLGIRSIDFDISAAGFDDDGSPVHFDLDLTNAPLGDLYALWR